MPITKSAEYKIEVRKVGQEKIISADRVILWWDDLTVDACDFHVLNTAGEEVRFTLTHEMARDLRTALDAFLLETTHEHSDPVQPTT